MSQFITEDLMLRTTKSLGALALPLTLAAALSVTSSAFAGDTLFMKTGEVKTKRVSVASLESAVERGVTTYVVQFRQAIRPVDKKNLTSLGAKILRYLPDDALVVSVDAKKIVTIAKSSEAIHSIVAYQPSWKVSADVETASVFTASSIAKYLVRLFPGSNESAAVEQISAIGSLKVDTVSGRSVVLVATRSALEALSAIESVEWVQAYPQIDTLDFKMNIEDTIKQKAGDFSQLDGYESGTKLMNFDAAYARGLDGKGQIVSMADTGLDSGDAGAIHADVAGRIPTGFSFGLFAKTWDDPMGHGTHVAGSVVGNGALSGGRIRGGAYNASFVPEGMWSPMMSNLTVPPKLADLFSKAYDAGARIHTNSWGSPRNPGEYEGMAQQVDEYMASHPDMLLIFAAGNSGMDKDKDGRIDPNSMGPPATAKNCLSVGASENLVSNGGIQKKMSEMRTGPESWPVEPLASSKLSDNPNGLAAFSSRGPTTDSRTKPDIVAPGTNILSLRSHHKDAEPLWGVYNQDYLWAGGTSMATPLTAGAATVVRQYLVEKRGFGKPSAALVKAVLMHTATDLFPGQFGQGTSTQEIQKTRPNSDEGFGRVNVDKATDLVTALIIDEQKGLATGETHTYPVKVTAQGKITATLMYTDAPASAGAAKALVNDLDLVLVDASGRETSANDHINNGELIETAIAPGTYEVRVKGTSVPQGITSGKQPYALVLSIM
jgi:serine protease AprX